LERRTRRQMRVELLHGREKSLRFLVPRQWRGVPPFALPLYHPQRPLEQITHVRQDLHGRPPAFTHPEARERGRRVPDTFRRAIRAGREGVTQTRPRRLTPRWR